MMATYLYFELFKLDVKMRLCGTDECRTKIDNFSFVVAAADTKFHRFPR
jgi:hypothetical protein